MLFLVVLLALGLGLIAFLIMVIIYSLCNHLLLEHAFLLVFWRIIALVVPGKIKRLPQWKQVRERIKEIRNTKKIASLAQCSPYACNGIADHFPTLLNLSTVNSLSECVHPDVICIDGRLGNEWQFAMIIASYPCGYNQAENPEFLVSKDGITWEIMESAPHPLLPSPKDGYSYNSDASLFLKDDKIYMINRLIHITKDRTVCVLQERNTSDGVYWSEPIDIYSIPCDNNRQDVFLSPSFLPEDGVIHTWYVDHDQGKHYVIKYGRFTRDFSEFEQIETIELSGLEKNETPWHLDVIKDRQGKYRMLLLGRDISTSKQNMYLASSEDGKKWTRLQLLCSACYAFELNGFYRGSLVNSADRDYLVYYTGIDKTNLYQTAVMKIEQLPN